MVQERYRVERDGEQIEVFNHASVKQFHYVNAFGGDESFEPVVTAGDAEYKPDYVTERLANYLWHAFGIEVEKLDIGVVEVEDA